MYIYAKPYSPHVSCDTFAGLKAMYFVKSFCSSFPSYLKSPSSFPSLQLYMIPTIRSGILEPNEPAELLARDEMETEQMEKEKKRERKDSKDSEVSPYAVSSCVRAGLCYVGP